MKSMTGFAKGNGETADYQIRIEIKSVNQGIYGFASMPKQLNDLEALIRQEVKKYYSVVGWSFIDIERKRMRA